MRLRTKHPAAQKMTIKDACEKNKYHLKRKTREPEHMQRLRKMQSANPEIKLQMLKIRF